jgi:hypothetical protein
MNELTLLKIAVAVAAVVFVGALVEIRRAQTNARILGRFHGFISWNPVSQKYGPPLTREETRELDCTKWEGD